MSTGAAGRSRDFTEVAAFAPTAPDAGPGRQLGSLQPGGTPARPLNPRLRQLDAEIRSPWRRGEPELGDPGVPPLQRAAASRLGRRFQPANQGPGRGAGRGLDGPAGSPCLRAWPRGGGWRGSWKGGRAGRGAVGRV